MTVDQIPIGRFSALTRLTLFSVGSTSSTSKPSLSDSLAMRVAISDSSPVALFV